MKNKLLSLSLLSGSFLSVQAVNYTNFIVINLDDVGYGDFSCNGAYGYTTPHIDRLASEGMRFTHFLSAQPISGASRAALLTGCYPNRIDLPGAPGPHSDRGINENEMTLGELVRQKGYRTAIFGKWHLGDALQFLPLQNGFDEYYGLPYSNDMWPNHPSGKFPDLPLMEGNKVIGYNTDQSRFTTDYTNKAIRFITANRKNPFLLYLAHSMAHVPLAVSDKFKGKSQQGLYGDVMMELDWSVGEIMKTLSELKLDKNTLVILTTDNGPWTNYGNHAGSAGGLREAKGTTFDGGNRVPCIMYWKGHIHPGTTYNRLTTNMDIFPTIAEICGAKLPDHPIDGISFLPVINGNLDANPRKTFAYYYHQNDLEAVTDGMFKLVLSHSYITYGAYPPGNDGKPGKLGRKDIQQPELYDLRRDPGERYDVFAQYPEVVAKLMKFADNIREELGDNLTGKEGKGRRPHGTVNP